MKKMIRLMQLVWMELTKKLNHDEMREYDALIEGEIDL